MLTIGDLNQVIKYYAFNIQQRIEELDHFTSHLQQDYDEIDNHYLQLVGIIDKYRGYVTHEEKEIKLANKLAERIVQIFDFFKAKSNNQNLLTIILQRIRSEIDQITQQNYIDLGQLFSLVHLIAKKGGLVRVPAQKRRVYSKSFIKETVKNETKITPTLSFYNIQRRGTSTAASHKHTKISSVVVQKWKLEDMLQGPWNCLDIQRNHLARIKQSNEHQVLRDMLRRNQKILNIMKKDEKKAKLNGTEASEDTAPRESTILSEMKSNSMKGSWLGKKRRPGTFVRKRNVTLKQNMSIMV